MKAVSAVIMWVAMTFLFGCATGPGIETRSREAAEEQEAMQRAEEFNRSLPPAR